MQAFSLSAQEAGADSPLWSRAAWSTEPGLHVGTVSQKEQQQAMLGDELEYSIVKHQPLLKIARARPGENF